MKKKHKLNVRNIFVERIWSWYKLWRDRRTPFRNESLLIGIVCFMSAAYIFGQMHAPQARCDYSSMVNEVMHYKAMADTCGNGIEFMWESALVEWRYLIIGAILLAWIMHGVGFSFVR